MKILSGVSHIDHDLSLGMLEYLKERFAGRDAFFIEEIELPEHLGTVSCGLYGPAMGDDPISETEVVYKVRGNRRCASRIAAPHMVNAGKRQTRKLVVIGGPYAGQYGIEKCVMYTAYGGPQAPREPGDPTIPTWEGVQEARKFWAEHCLVDEG